RRHLRAGQDAALPGFRALREFYLDHLHLIRCRVLAEAAKVEIPLRIAATEITRTQFPHQIAAIDAVPARDRAFAGIVIEPDAPRAFIQGLVLVRLMSTEY